MPIVLTSPVLGLKKQLQSTVNVLVSVWIIGRSKFIHIIKRRTKSKTSNYAEKFVFDSVFVELTNAALTFRTAFSYVILHVKYRTRSSEMPMVSAISRVKLGSLQTISKTCSMISGVVALFGRPLRGSSSTLVRPRLNSKTHRCTKWRSRFL